MKTPVNILKGKQNQSTKNTPTLIHVTFKSFLVLELKIIKAYKFSYATRGKLYLSRKLRSRLILCCLQKQELSERTKPNCRNPTCIFFLNIVTCAINPWDFHSSFLFFHFNILILKQVISCKCNYIDLV